MTSGAVPTAEQPGAGQVVPRGFGAALTHWIFNPRSYLLCSHQERMCVSLGSHYTKVLHTQNLSDLRHSSRAAIAVFVCEQKPYPLWFSWQRKSYPVKHEHSLGKKIHLGETTRNDEWQDVSNQAAGHFNRQNWHSSQNKAIPRRQKSHKILWWNLFSFRARHSKPAGMNERFSSIIFAEAVKRKIL